MLKYYYSLLYTFVLIKSQEVTFTNINVHLQNWDAANLSVSVPSASNLAAIGEEEYHTLRIVNQKIPVLYRNSMIDLRNIENIYLNRNKLRLIEIGAFGEFLNTSLNFDFNLLEEIRDGIFTNLRGVTSLSMRYNDIFSIHQNAFANMSELRRINLSNNKIKTWEGSWFVGCPLERIFMTYNLLTSLPRAAFSFNEKFHTVDLGYNKIQNLSSEVFENVKSVDYLLVYKNKIVNINDTTFERLKVKVFDVRYNKVMCFPKNPRYFVSVEAIAHFGNPLLPICEAEIDQWPNGQNKMNFTLTII